MHGAPHRIFKEYSIGLNICRTVKRKKMLALSDNFLHQHGLKGILRKQKRKEPRHMTEFIKKVGGLKLSL